MKNIILLMWIVSTTIACKKNEEDFSIVGKYKLKAVLSDPGDGSGTFESVTSSKTIEFFDNGTIEANGELCVTGIEANATVNGTYSASDSTINTANCTILSYELAGDVLTINIPCDEPCKARYKRE